MGTFLFDSIIFGPVSSRRLGRSLGINLLPADSKLCNFNCVYCECGWSLVEKKNKVPTYDDFTLSLEEYLKNEPEAQQLDVITFAGNGEPTLHPDFERIIDKTIELRDKYVPNLKIAVLTNATRLDKQKIADTLRKIDMAILKIDTVVQVDFETVNCPTTKMKVDKIVDNIIKYFKNPIIQTMFFKGKINGRKFDNTKEESFDLYLEALKRISPDTVMIYSIARDTPMSGLERIEISKLESLGDEIRKAGFNTLVTP